MIELISVSISPTTKRFVQETLHKAHAFETLLSRIKSRTPQRGTKYLLDTAKAISQTISTSLEIELEANPQFSDEQITESCTRRHQLIDSLHKLVFDVIQPTEYTLYPIGIITATEYLITEFIPVFALILNPYSGNTYEITAYRNLLDVYRTSLSPYVKEKSTEENNLPEWIIILSYPAVQSTNILLHTIMVGHEVMHLKDYVLKISSSLISTGEVKIIKEAVRREAHLLSRNRAELFEETGPVLLQWLRELIADLIAARTFGPAYLFSFACLSFALEVMDQYSDRHPSSRIRLALMLEELKNLGYMKRRNATRKIKNELKYWLDFTTVPSSPPTGASNIALKSIMRAKKRITSRVRATTHGQEYSIDRFMTEVPPLLKYLQYGIPPSEILDISSRSSEPATLASTLNAGMFFCLEGMNELKEILASEENPTIAAMTKLDELLSRAIEVSFALQQWKQGED